MLLPTARCLFVQAQAWLNRIFIHSSWNSYSNKRSVAPFIPFTLHRTATQYRIPAPLPPHRTSIIHGPTIYTCTFLHHHQDEARFTRSPIIATLNAANPSATFAAARFNLLLRSSSRAARYAASSSAFRLLPATTPARNTRACVVARILIDEEDDDESGSGDDSGMVFCHDQNNAM